MSFLGWIFGGIVAIFAVFAGLALQETFSEPPKLAGKRVIITGASTGIGAEIALYYSEQHAHVVVIARNEERLQSVVAECKARGAASANYIVADLGSEDDAYFSSLIDKSLNFLDNKLDTLVLNHIVTTGAYRSEGYYYGHDMENLTKLFYVNTFSYFALAHFATPSLETSAGKIIAVGSAAGKMGLPRVAQYSATKHAIFGYFDSLRQDFRRKNSKISITTCILGSIDTPNARKNAKEVREDMWTSASECAKSIVNGGEKRYRDVYFPFWQVYPVVWIRNFPNVVNFLVDNVM